MISWCVPNYNLIWVQLHPPFITLNTPLYVPAQRKCTSYPVFHKPNFRYIKGTYYYYYYYLNENKVWVQVLSDRWYFEKTNVLREWRLSVCEGRISNNMLFCEETLVKWIQRKPSVFLDLGTGPQSCGVILTGAFISQSIHYLCPVGRLLTAT